jgi:hypothetical protein
LSAINEGSHWPTDGLRRREDGRKKKLIQILRPEEQSGKQYQLIGE